MEEFKKKSVLETTDGTPTFPVASPTGKTAAAGARTTRQKTPAKKDGPAEAAARIKKRKKKEKQKRQHDIDLLVTIMPTAVNATNIMRLLSPRVAPRYTFDPVLLDPKDKDKVNEITGAAHQLF